MLRHLVIRNFALVDKLELQFGEGLNLFTGETGSGKSILVGAVGLLLGRRAAQEMIREGFTKAEVEGLFSVELNSPARQQLDSAGLVGSDGEVVIRREISSSGANRVYINGHLTTLSFLSELGQHLADIHGQHDQQRLLQPGEHLKYLDAFAENAVERQTVQTVFDSLQETRAALSRIRGTEQERLRNVDHFRFQIQEIDRLDLKPGLDQQLLREKRLLSTAEGRLRHSTFAYQGLYESETSVASQLGTLQRELEDLVALDDKQAGLLDRMEGLRFGLDEIAFELRDYSNSIEFNPARLEAVEERLAGIRELTRKYGDTVEDILAYRGKIEQDLEVLEHASEQGSELELEEERLQEAYLTAAKHLSSTRRGDSARLSQAMESELAELAMSSTVFAIEVDSDEAEASQQGIDRVEFLISPNPGESPKPLAKIASGGELSRVILALKSLLTVEKYPKTLIFDEVDAGLGGRVASALGERLSALSDRNQVFCVTHLPQIAARAAHHFFVSKAQDQERTRVEVSALSDVEREEELARMLAGKKVTATALEQAKALLAGE
jgi:DNA repair protein RecN (Recombination protein N)